MKIEFIAEKDATGLGRVVVDGRFYGLPAEVVSEFKSLRQQVMELEENDEIIRDDYQRLLATAKKMGDELAALKKEQEEVTNYARQLAISLHEKHFPDVKEWQPLDSLLGLLTQIDNMICGLELAATPKPESKNKLEYTEETSRQIWLQNDEPK